MSYELYENGDVVEVKQHKTKIKIDYFRNEIDSINALIDNLQLKK